MAATNFTPISLYYTTTAAAAPSAGNLVNGELAINITDGKLYYKDNLGVVKLLANAADLGGVSTFSGGTTGLTPATATNGAITLGGTLIVGNGGTGATTFTSGGLLRGNGTSALSIASAADIVAQIGSTAVANATNAVNATTSTNLAGGIASQIPYQSSAGTTAFIANGTSGQVLKSNGTSAPSWENASALSVTTISFGTTGLTPATATGGAVTVAGTLALANGGTGATTVAGAQTNLEVDPAGTAVAMAIALG
jgi:hypothetical protein